MVTDLPLWHNHCYREMFDYLLAALHCNLTEHCCCVLCSSPPPSGLRPEGNTPAARVYYEKLREQQATETEQHPHAIAELQQERTDANTATNALPPSSSSSSSSSLPPLPGRQHSGESQQQVRFTADTVDHCRTEDSLSQIRLGTPMPPANKGAAGAGEGSLGNVSPAAEVSDTTLRTNNLDIGAAFDELNINSSDGGASGLPPPPHSPQALSR